MTIVHRESSMNKAPESCAAVPSLFKNSLLLGFFYSHKISFSRNKTEGQKDREQNHLISTFVTNR